ETENILTVTFDLDGGQWELGNVQSVNYNDLITSFIPTKSGFEFDGWVEKGIWSDTKFDSTTNITKDYNLTATWIPFQYKVSYDLNGGSWSKDNVQTLTAGEKISTTYPTKAGHSFMGWFIDGVKFDINTPI